MTLSHDRPPKELKAVERVALDPDESATVALELTAEDLAFWNPDTEGWVVEAVRFDILIGSSSRDIELEEHIEITESAELDTT